MFRGEIADENLSCAKNPIDTWEIEGWMDGWVGVFRTSIEVLVVETAWWVLAVQSFYILYICLKGFLSTHIS